MPVDVPESGRVAPDGHDGLDIIFKESGVDYRTLPAISVRNGTTDYIDMVSDFDLYAQDSKEPLAVGVFKDCFGRSGFAMRVTVTDAKTDEVRERCIYTVFQRYTGGRMLVMCRSHCGLKGVTVRTRGEGTLERIVGASTRVSEDGELVLRAIIKAHLGGGVYTTADNKHQVRLGWAGARAPCAQKNV